MKNKLLCIGVLAITSAGSFLVGRYIPNTPPSTTTNVKMEASHTARLSLDGTTYKLLANTYADTTNFILLDDKTGDTVATFSVSNMFVEAPAYRIVKGRTHDWLVVTKIDEKGTGYMSHVNQWYILEPSGQMKLVFDYPSDGFQVPDENGMNDYWTSNIDNISQADDSVVDVTFDFKKCTTTSDGMDKDCSSTSSKGHYVWDATLEKFVRKK